MPFLVYYYANLGNFLHHFELVFTPFWAYYYIVLACRKWCMKEVKTM